MKPICGLFALLFSLVASCLIAAPALIPGYYLGHSTSVFAGQSGEAFEMWVGPEGPEYAICGDFDAVPKVKDGIVRMSFTPGMFFVGVIGAGGANVNGRLTMYSPKLGHWIVRPFNLRATQVPGKMTITGAAVYHASPDGAVMDLDLVGNTIGWFDDQDFNGNVYLFRATGHGRIFYGGGNTTATINPNVWLTPGRHRIHFVVSGILEDHVALRLYLDNDQEKHLTVYSPTDGSAPVTAVPAGTMLNGRASSGSLSLSNDDVTATVTDLRVLRHPDLMWSWYLEPDDEPDTVGSFTVVVRRNANAIDE